MPRHETPILAGAHMTKPPRIRPYKTFAVSGDGERTPIRAHEVVLERAHGVDLELNLAPPLGFRGFLSFATFRGCGITIEPAAANLAYLFVENWPADDQRRKSARRRSRGSILHAYLTDSRGEKQPTDQRAFVVQIAPNSELHINFRPRAPWADHIEVSTPKAELLIRLNAGNIVMFAPGE